MKVMSRFPCQIQSQHSIHCEGEAQQVDAKLMRRDEASDELLVWALLKANCSLHFFIYNKCALLLKQIIMRAP